MLQIPLLPLFLQIILLHIKTMETHCVNCKKILQTKIIVLEELNRID